MLRTLSNQVVSIAKVRVPTIIPVFDQSDIFVVVGFFFSFIINWPSHAERYPCIGCPSAMQL